MLKKKYLMVVILHDCWFSYVCGTQLYNVQGKLQIQHSIGHNLKTFKHLFSFREIKRLIFGHLIHTVEPVFTVSSFIALWLKRKQLEWPCTHLTSRFTST